MVEEHVDADVLCQLLGILELICNKICITSRVGATDTVVYCAFPPHLPVIRGRYTRYMRENKLQ